MEQQLPGLRPARYAFNRAAASQQTVLFQGLMAGVLTELGEYRRAIPFCEQAIRLEWEKNDPAAMSELLFRVGQCYCLSELRDHAVAPLRGAVKIFRSSHGDPRLSAALVTLGNALRKSSPAEAENC